MQPLPHGKKKMKHEDTKNAVKKPLKKKNTTAITSLMMSAAFFFFSLFLMWICRTCVKQRDKAHEDEQPFGLKCPLCMVCLLLKAHFFKKRKR